MPPPANVPTVGLHAITDDDVILDVREPDEWAAGHIDGALHVPMGAIPQHLEELPDDHRLAVVCRSGGRSARVTEYLRQQGLDAVNVDGGMTAWAKAGRPMAADGDADPSVI